MMRKREKETRYSEGVESSRDKGEQQRKGGCYSFSSPQKDNPTDITENRVYSDRVELQNHNSLLFSMHFNVIHKREKCKSNGSQLSHREDSTIMPNAESSRLWLQAHDSTCLFLWFGDMEQIQSNRNGISDCHIIWTHVAS